GMRGFRIAADVDARAAGGEAELVDDELPDPLDRIGAVTHEEAGQAWIAGEAADEIVGDRGKRIVAAQALVQGRRGRLLGGRRRGDGEGDDTCGKGSD